MRERAKTWQPDDREVARLLDTYPLDLLDVEHLADEIEKVDRFTAPALVSGRVNQVGPVDGVAANAASAELSA